jgi:hypothetical protein
LSPLVTCTSFTFPKSADSAAAAAVIAITVCPSAGDVLDSLLYCVDAKIFEERNFGEEL